MQKIDDVNDLTVVRIAQINSGTGFRLLALKEEESTSQSND